MNAVRWLKIFAGVSVKIRLRRAGSVWLVFGNYAKLKSTMERTRTILSEEERENILRRDGSDCWFYNCDRQGTDFDHAFVLGNNGKRFKEQVLNKGWNIHLICRPCHTQITYPVNQQDFMKRLFVMKDALQKVMFDKTIGVEDIEKLYRIYKERKVFTEQKYGVPANQ